MSSVSAVERLVRRENDVDAVRRAVTVAREALERVRSLPAAEEPIPVPSRDDDTRILRLATPILVVTHVLFIGQSLFNVVADGSGQLAHLVLLPVTFALQFRHLAAARAGTRPRGLAWTLTAQALTIYAPLLVGDASGLVVSGFFAGVVLLHLRSPVAWPLCSAICAFTAVQAWPGGPGVAAYQLVGTLATALTVYGLTRLAALVTELRKTRAELVEVAALRERLKVGRDVHDLLGRSLTTIVLHGELALRLFGTDPGRAAEQLGRVTDGAAPAPGEPGTGLRNLRARLATVGGELTTARTGDRFELLARAPVDHEDLTRTR